MADMFIPNTQTYIYVQPKETHDTHVRLVTTPYGFLGILTPPTLAVQCSASNASTTQMYTLDGLRHKHRFFPSTTTYHLSLPHVDLLTALHVCMFLWSSCRIPGRENVLEVDTVGQSYLMQVCYASERFGEYSWHHSHARGH